MKFVTKIIIVAVAACIPAIVGAVLYNQVQKTGIEHETYNVLTITELGQCKDGTCMVRAERKDGTVGIFKTSSPQLVGNTAFEFCWKSVNDKTGCGEKLFSQTDVPSTH